MKAAQSLQFFYNPSDQGGPLTCNEVLQDTKSPSKCEFDANDTLSITREGWGGASAVITFHEQPDGIDNCDKVAESGACAKVAGDCAKSLIKSGIPDAYDLISSCLPGAGRGPRQDATGEVLLNEWFADLPWHQKLSTLDSNVIETPFVLPFEAIPPDLCPSVLVDAERARCMLRYGIVNVMAMHRTDTMYRKGETNTQQDCVNEDCVEVKLRIQRFNTQTKESPGYQPDIVKNNTYKHPDNSEIPSLGFAITEATIFAPWRNWYTGHYCAVESDNIADSVCYEDYFTTQLVAPANPHANQFWPGDNPAIFSPTDVQGSGIFEKFCGKGLDHCLMYLGKVDWAKDASEPLISGCKSRALSECEDDVADKTARLDRQFDAALQSFFDVGRYPWDDKDVPLSPDLARNPFIGFYALDLLIDDAIDAAGNPLPWLYKAQRYALPKRCTKQDYVNARHGDIDGIVALEDCVMNFEVHTSGFHEQWASLYGGSLDNTAVEEISKAFVGVDANQYGRTMFMYAGVREQHIPVSFRLLDDGLSIYDKVYNASLYTQYIPMVNIADQSLLTKSYGDNFWHAVFMSNHMNQDPDHFIRGIRGRTLWHNEYRSNFMYESAVQGVKDKTTKTRIKGTRFENVLYHVDFPAGFQPQDAATPFHGNTCDSCHVRNGSGIPLMPNGKLAKIHTDRGMKDEVYEINRDYTYSNPELPAMKMVLFDLKDDRENQAVCDADDHTTLTRTPSDSGIAYYNNKIMNFYGNSIHVNQHNNLPTYHMEYQKIVKNDGFEIVDETDRGVSTTFDPMRINISNLNMGNECQDILDTPANVNSNVWPKTCNEVSGEAVLNAISSGQVGYMHLMGRRLGNTPMIEMMPDKAIKEALEAQASGDMKYAGCYGLVAGTRLGEKGDANYRNCVSGRHGEDFNDCYISRWGWIGDRASLEDQVANAANVEMNLTSIEGYRKLHRGDVGHDHLVRYNKPLCGPADAGCQASKANSDISEQEIQDMATYQRWIGIPNRSEYQVSSSKVQDGEKIFRDRLQCNSCHVIDKIPFKYSDNMLPDEEREKLRKLQLDSDDSPEYPFISYLGTDLLLHDMGYLSQVAKAPDGMEIRNPETGEIKDAFESYIQRIRTPALKGLRFNRFVTDSNHNSKCSIKDAQPTKDDPPKPPKCEEEIPGCDFLLHDGRACDAIEAAYLHDGPAFKALGTIEEMNRLTEDELDQLRAFLYSL
ncbi:MAG: hypothetical protein ACWA5Q_11000 [bacterium]